MYATLPAFNIVTILHINPLPAARGEIKNNKGGFLGDALLKQLREMSLGATLLAPAMGLDSCLP